MSRPIVTLTTDFGLRDHFAGTMKGVILRIEPRAEIVDISHGVSAYAIVEAGFLIAQAYRYFPRKTVHVIVVDPGVGTARRPILAEAAGQYFVAPDNGVLSMVYAQEKHKVRAITNQAYFLKPVSQTFHGRDVFSPVAAHLAKGVAPARFGKLIRDYLQLQFHTPARTGKRSWTGAILKIDRFGNLITNFRASDLPAGQFELTLGPRRVTRLVRTFAEGSAGELIVVEGSSGYLEIASNQASAAAIAGCGAGAPVELTIL
jgi:S-adenosylmethionine hydrolase